MRYSRINVAAPAAFGVAMDVPVYSRYQVDCQLEPAMSCASCARQERTYPPGAIISGLIRPSSVGPRDEPDMRLSGAPLYRAWWFPTVTTFFAVDGEPTVPAPGPSFPAANKIVSPSCPLLTLS